MKIPYCSNCGWDEFDNVLDTAEVNIDGQTLVIKNIPSLKCRSCGEIHYENEASRYIDNQIAIFRAEGFENKSKEIVKQKGITQEELGNMIGVTKQRINQIFKDDNLDVKTMYRIANAINEPIQKVFTFNRIIRKEDKFYIEHSE